MFCVATSEMFSLATQNMVSVATEHICLVPTQENDSVGFRSKGANGNAGGGSVTE